MANRFANAFYALMGSKPAEALPTIPKALPALLEVPTFDAEVMAELKGALGMTQFTTPHAPRPLPDKPEIQAKEGYEGNTLVYRCTSIIAKAVASIPLRLMSGDKAMEEDAHPLAKLLAKPNPTQSTSDFLEWLTAYFVLLGNAMTEQVIGVDGAPIELWVWQPYRFRICDPVDPRTPYPSQYEYRDGNGAHDRTWEVDPISGQSDIIHWRAFGPLNRWWGVPALKPAASDVDQNTEAGEWNRKNLANNMQPPGMLQSSGKLTPDQVADLKEQVRQRFQGPNNARTPLVLTGEFSWTAFGNNAQEMDWLKGSEMSAWKICAAYGVPTQVVPVPGGQTFANYEQARLALWEDTVIPTAQSLVALLNRVLVPRFADAQRRKLRIELNLENIPALLIRRAEKWKSIGEAHFLSLNEKRIALGYPPLKNPEADAVLVDAAKLPISPTVEKEDETSPTGVTGDGSVQDTAMNGAQVAGLLSILEAVTSGAIPADSALQMLLLAFPTIDPNEAAALINPLRNFVPDTPEPEPVPAGTVAPNAPDVPPADADAEKRLTITLQKRGFNPDAIAKLIKTIRDAR
jgi:HK97 family phage portal protein